MTRFGDCESATRRSGQDEEQLRSRDQSCGSIRSINFKPDGKAVSDIILGMSEASYDRIVKRVDEELKQYFRPKFLNRLDDIIVFWQLSHTEIKQIADLLLTEFTARLREQGIRLEVSDRVEDRVVEAGYHRGNPIGSSQVWRLYERRFE